MVFEKDPLKAAKQLMHEYHSTDPYVLAEKTGCIILYADLGDVNYAQRDRYKRVDVITLNDQADEAIQRYALAHEIGHVVLHRGFSTAFFRKSSGSRMVNWVEKEANEFAMQIMLASFDQSCGEQSSI